MPLAERQAVAPSVRWMLHTSEPISGPFVGVRGGVEVRPQAVDSTCGEVAESVELPRTPVEQSVGPEECRTFFGEPLAHRLRAGHRTLPPINQRPWPKRRSGIRQERRSVPRGNSWRRPGDGVGGVGESVGSRGASPSLLARGPLGAHTIERPSPLLPLWNRPCRCQGGDRVPTGLPEGARVPSRRRFAVGESGNPRRSRFAGRGSGPRSQPVRRRRNGTRSSKASAGGDLDPDHSRLAGGGTGPGQQRKLHTAGQTRGVGPVTGAAGDGGAGRTRWASSPPRPEGPLGAHTTR